MPSNQLALALWLEADRMGQLLPAMTQQKLDTQRDVVKNERRWSVDNQPYGTWWEKLPALAFPPEHPFHHSLIGSMEDLSAASLDDIAEFFSTYYTPDNAVLSMAGDVDLAEARRLVEEYLRSHSAWSVTAALPPMECRRASVHRGVKSSPTTCDSRACISRFASLRSAPPEVHGERVRRGARHEAWQPASSHAGSRAPGRC